MYKNRQHRSRTQASSKLTTQHNPYLMSNPAATDSEGDDFSDSKSEVPPDFDERFYSKTDRSYRKIDKTPLAPQLQPLRDALDDKKPPYCAGVLPAHDEDLILYYGKGDHDCR